MKKLIIGAMVLGLSCLAANAEEWKVGDITISAPFARASAGMANAGGGFIANHETNEETPIGSLRPVQRLVT